MRRLPSLLAAAALPAVFFVALGQTPAPAAETVVYSVNLASIQAVFDNAGVPARTGRDSDGTGYVETELGGNPMTIYPGNCEGGDPTGKCASIILVSGTFAANVTLEQVVAYAISTPFSTPFPVGEKRYALRTGLVVKNGIGPNFVEGALVQFSVDMKDFGAFLAATDGGGKTAKPGFAAHAGDSGLALPDGALSATPGLAAGALAK
jgi:hypothetical protein